MRMRKRKNKQTNTKYNIKHGDLRGTGRARATKTNRNKRKTWSPVSNPIRNLTHSAFGPGQAMPWQTMSSQVKTSQRRPNNIAKPSRARPGRTNSSKFYLYQMTFMLHPFHFLLSTCRVTSIISSIPVDFAQYSHGYWYTLIRSYTLKQRNVSTPLALIRRKQSEMITEEQKLNRTERQIYHIDLQ